MVVSRTSTAGGRMNDLMSCHVMLRRFFEEEIVALVVVVVQTWEEEGGGGMVTWRSLSL